MGSMSKDEVNVFLFDEVKFLKATLVQMREAIEKLLPKVSCDSIACQPRCLCGAEKISEYGRKLLSQTQDVAAWLKDHDDKVAREVWKEVFKIVPEGHYLREILQAKAELAATEDK